MKNKLIFSISYIFILMLTQSCKKENEDPSDLNSSYFEFTFGGQEYKMDVVVFDEDDRSDLESPYYLIEIAGHNGLSEDYIVPGLNIYLPLDKLDNPVGEYRVGNYLSSSPLYPGSAAMEIYSNPSYATHGGPVNVQIGSIQIKEFIKGDGSESYLFKQLSGTFDLDVFEYDQANDVYKTTPIKTKGKFKVQNVISISESLPIL